MPNRVLRDGILRSERVDRLSPGAEIFYRRLMSVVDDFGRYYASSKLLNADCYPLKDETMPVEDYLAECAAGDEPLIVVYTVAGKKYLEVQDFQQRQRSESKFPAPPRTADITPPLGSGLPSYDRHPPSSASAAPSRDSGARPLRAGAVEGEGEGVVEDEGGDARTREETPPPLSTETDVSNGAEIAKLLQMAMPRGFSPPDSGIVRQVSSAMQGATMPELAAAITQRRRRGQPPKSYGFWPIYLQDILAPEKRAALGAIAVAADPPPVPKPPACASCRGSGVVGRGATGCSAEQIRADLRAGGKLCGCEIGEGWAEYFALDGDGYRDDVPAIQSQTRAAVAL